MPGPEVPLVKGIEQHFRKVGIHCFGPTKEAARMEGSKTFAKDFMKRHNIPTAAYENFTELSEALNYLDSVDHNVVIKASGLAAGKGVIIPASKTEARQALERIMKDKEFGSAGDEVVVEEFLEGEELSVLAFSDGFTIKALPAAQDHKRIYDGDEGPNTGGMGCYSPIPVESPALRKVIHETILQPTIDGMCQDDYPFLGMLFTGIMLTKSGPKVLEYNVRFGDPETQTLLPLLDCDLAAIILGCVQRRLRFIDIQVKKEFSVTVVVAAGGYPNEYAKGDTITIGTLTSDTTVFHAGTSKKESKIVTAGGRVLAVTSISSTLQFAARLAYQGVEQISFTKAFYRKDIAHRALNRTEPSEAPLTYAASGVDIQAGNDLVKYLKPITRATSRLGADAEIGGFGGIFKLAELKHYTKPVLVAAIDGVGTKLRVAVAMDKHDTVGIDLVAMNVNDLVVQGAEPLFFLDYYSCAKLVIDRAVDFVKGVGHGCVTSGSALLGGETAEMPGMYIGGDYDTAGCAVGVVEDGRELPRKSDMQEGDVVLGLSSSGLHSNGFSLVHKIVQITGISYHDSAPWDSSVSLGNALLEPTRIYVKDLLPLCTKELLKGMAHITGGGLLENVPRALPKHLSAEIDLATWQVPEIFRWMKRAGRVPTDDISKTLNMGIGMVLIVSASAVSDIKESLASADLDVYEIGRLIQRKSDHGCVFLNKQCWDF